MTQPGVSFQKSQIPENQQPMVKPDEIDVNSQNKSVSPHRSSHPLVDPSRRQYRDQSPSHSQSSLTSLPFSLKVTILALIILLLYKYDILSLPVPIATLYTEITTFIFFLELGFYIYFRSRVKALQYYTNIEQHSDTTEPSSRQRVFDVMLTTLSSHQYNDCRDVYFFLSQWFLYTAPIDPETNLPQIPRGNFLQWLAWALFYRFPNQLNAEEAIELSGYVDQFEQCTNIRFPLGFNPDVRSMRLSLEPLTAVHRPVLYYCMMAVFQSLTKVFLSNVSGFTRKRIGGFHYWYRPRDPRLTHTRNKLPLVFIHGLGHGLLSYLHFLFYCRDRDIFLVELSFIANKIFEYNPRTGEVVTFIDSMLQEQNYRSAVFMGHSFGSFIVAWMIKYRPALVHGAFLLDPVALTLCLPTTCYSFVYKKPESIMEYIRYYTVSQELGVSTVMRRHFWWTENALFLQDLPRKPFRPCLPESLHADDEYAFYPRHIRPPVAVPAAAAAAGGARTHPVHSGHAHGATITEMDRNTTAYQPTIEHDRVCSVSSQLFTLSKEQQQLCYQHLGFIPQENEVDLYGVFDQFGAPDISYRDYYDNTTGELVTQGYNATTGQTIHKENVSRGEVQFYSHHVPITHKNTLVPPPSAAMMMSSNPTMPIPTRRHTTSGDMDRNAGASELVAPIEGLTLHLDSSNDHHNPIGGDHDDVDRTTTLHVEDYDYGRQRHSSTHHLDYHHHDNSIHENGDHHDIAAVTSPSTRSMASTSQHGGGGVPLPSGYQSFNAFNGPTLSALNGTSTGDLTTASSTGSFTPQQQQALIRSASGRGLFAVRTHLPCGCYGTCTCGKDVQQSGDVSLLLSGQLQLQQQQQQQLQQHLVDAAQSFHDRQHSMTPMLPQSNSNDVAELTSTRTTYMSTSATTGERLLTTMKTSQSMTSLHHEGEDQYDDGDRLHSAKKHPHRRVSITTTTAAATTTTTTSRTGRNSERTIASSTSLMTSASEITTQQRHRRSSSENTRSVSHLTTLPHHHHRDSDSDAKNDDVDAVDMLGTNTQHSGNGNTNDHHHHHHHQPHNPSTTPADASHASASGTLRQRFLSDAKHIAPDLDRIEELSSDSDRSSLDQDHNDDSHSNTSYIHRSHSDDGDHDYPPHSQHHGENGPTKQYLSSSTPNSPRQSIDYHHHHPMHRMNDNSITSPPAAGVGDVHSSSPPPQHVQMKLCVLLGGLDDLLPSDRIIRHIRLHHQHHYRQDLAMAMDAIHDDIDTANTRYHYVNHSDSKKIALNSVYPSSPRAEAKWGGDLHSCLQSTLPSTSTSNNSNRVNGIGASNHTYPQTHDHLDEIQSSSSSSSRVTSPSTYLYPHSHSQQHPNLQHVVRTRVIYEPSHTHGQMLFSSRVRSTIIKMLSWLANEVDE